MALFERSHRTEEFHLVRIEDEMLTNTPLHGRRWPEMPWTYWLFCEGFKRNSKGVYPKRGIKFVHEMTAPTETEALAKLEEFVTRPNVECKALKETA